MSVAAGALPDPLRSVVLGRYGAVGARQVDRPQCPPAPPAPAPAPAATPAGAPRRRRTTTAASAPRCAAATSALIVPLAFVRRPAACR